MYFITIFSAHPNIQHSPPKKINKGVRLNPLF